MLTLKVNFLPVRIWQNRKTAIAAIEDKIEDLKAENDES